MNTFASIEHIDKIQSILLPRVEAFSNMIDDLLSDNDQIREVVRKFDESISMKANKTEYQIMKGNLEKMFIPVEEFGRIL